MERKRTYTHARTHTKIYKIVNKCIYNHHHHSVPWLGEGFNMLLTYLPILRYPLLDGTLPVVDRFVSPTSRRFPGGDTQCPSVISYPADVPCPVLLPSSDLFNHVSDLCIFSYPDICFSVPVCGF